MGTYKVHRCSLVCFFFVFSNFYQLRLHNKSSCCISKSTMKYFHQKTGLRLCLPGWLSYGYRKCMVVGFVIGYTCPPNCVRFKCGVVINIWGRSPISFSLCLYEVCSLIPAEAHYQSNLGGLIKKTCHLRLVYLMQPLPWARRVGLSIYLSICLSSFHQHWRSWSGAIKTIWDIR